MPTIIVTSLTIHAQSMARSYMLMGMSMHELDINKDVNPEFHEHESYSHTHEVLPRLHAHKAL